MKKKLKKGIFFLFAKKGKYVYSLYIVQHTLTKVGGFHGRKKENYEKSYEKSCQESYEKSNEESCQESYEKSYQEEKISSFFL